MIIYSYSPFVDTVNSVEGNMVIPELYVLAVCRFVNASVILHQNHISRVFSSDSYKQSYDPCYFVSGNTVFLPLRQTSYDVLAT